MCAATWAGEARAKAKKADAGSNDNSWLRCTAWCHHCGQCSAHELTYLVHAAAGAEEAQTKAKKARKKADADSADGPWHRSTARPARLQTIKCIL